MGPRVLLLLTALLLVAASAEADEAPLRTMTLEDALAHARRRHPRVRAAKGRLGAAEREARVPPAQWLPRLGAMAQLMGSTANNSTTTLLGTSAVDIPRIGATSITNDYDAQPYPSTAVALGLRQQIYDFGRVAAESAPLEASVEVERLRTEATALDVDFTVKQAYYAALAAEGIADASRAAYQRAASHRDLARANVGAGLRPPIELTRAEADVARYESSMVRARSNVHVARTELSAAIGVDDLEVAPAPLAVEASPLSSMKDLVGLAKATPAVREAQAREAVAHGETRRIEAQTRPTIFATLSASGRAGGAPPNVGPLPYGDGWLPLVPNYNAGLVLTWSFLDPANDRRADAAQERELATAAETELVLRNVRAAVASAYREAAVAQETLSAVVRGADAARANWEQADRRFAVGLGTSTELADAQALRAEAEIQLAVAQFQVARARAALERAAGGRR